MSLLRLNRDTTPPDTDFDSSCFLTLLVQKESKNEYTGDKRTNDEVETATFHIVGFPWGLRRCVYGRASGR